MGSEKFFGNLLGGARAESDDKMLKTAFVETADFQALTNTRDFNFVVGRRGTGKSALYMKVAEFLTEHKIGFVYREAPLEYEALGLLGTIKETSDEYLAVRSITRVAWRISLLLGTLKDICSNYKFSKCKNSAHLFDCLETYKSLIGYNCYERVSVIIKSALSAEPEHLLLPKAIAKKYNIENLQDAIDEALSTFNKISYFLFDGLDEGWQPEQASTAIIGGLAACASDFSDKRSGVQVVLFIRDNIFRSLSFFDRDFSRHIEGNTLRLRWDDSSLLHLVSNRLRITLGLSQESDIKVWNRFAQKDLQDRVGFISCLHYTLYRPRDLLVLLNEAHITALRSGRSEIIGDDIEASSKQISQNRLEDLLKEYAVVFPGLPLLVAIFEGGLAFHTYSEFINILDEEISNNTFESQKASDFAVLESGRHAFFALYSVGFIGLENNSSGKLQFCHDGSSANVDATSMDQRACIHPCYWKALNIQPEAMKEEVLIEVYDDINPSEHKDFEDIRTKMIGQLVSQLPLMAQGDEAASKFEDWVFRTIKTLFAGQLSNPELKPNKDAIQRRDIVTTNMAKEGFWRRVREDYKARQIIFEVKNYSSLKPDDFRQALSYSNETYGKFIVIVDRSENEGVSDKEKGWIKEIWDNHSVMIFLLPAIILSRSVGKLRSRNRFDYAENLLNKRLDIFIRSYLSLRHNSKTKKTKSKISLSLKQDVIEGED
jgi:hypothetical protein